MKKLAVIGGGESGIGAAILGQKEGWEVWVSDARQIHARYKKILDEYQLPYEMGGHTIEKFFEADTIVKSPGVPDRVPLVKSLRKQGKEVISEIEFAFRYCRSKVIAITGSNGKTTTTALIHHLLKEAGYDAGLAGNIGDSFAKAVAESQPECFVVEVSSFQLDDVQRFRPDIALLLNITADHLDRYEYQIEKYAEAKLNIAQQQQPKDLLIYFAEDAVTAETLPKLRSQPRQKRFAHAQAKEVEAWLEEGKLCTAQGWRFDFSQMKIKGQHNALNALAALIAVAEYGLTAEEVEKGLFSFAPITHRFEQVAIWQQVVYINDSKATNVASAYYALESMTQPTVWIAGGQDKGNDYSSILPLVEKHVKAIVVLGEGEEKIRKTFQKPTVATTSIEAAVEAAHTLSQPGDTVLLSPACASFDLFTNYMERGELFKQEVLKRKKEDI